MSLTCHSSMTKTKMTIIIIYFPFFLFQVSLIFFSISFILVNAANITEISSYAKVSRNGPELINNFKSSLENSNNQGRSFQVSPVYVASKVSQLKNGEAFDYPSTPRYSTLDEDMLAHYDDKNIHKEAQDRFRPPPRFASSNVVRQQSNPPTSSSSGNSPIPLGSSPAASSSSGDYSTLPKPVLSSDYNYATAKPMKDTDTPSFTIDTYSPDDSYSQKPGPYAPIKTPYQGPDKLPSYLEKFPPKSQFPGYVDESFPHDHDHEHFHYDHDDDDDGDDHNFHHDVIYDHPPDHYDHHHHHHHPMMTTTTTTTTEEPDMNDQRLSKRPYSYYYLGKKLWYLPLYFSIYFIIYIAALVLKSIARHKINFPNTLAHLADSRSVRNSPSWWDLTRRVLEAIDNFSID